MKKDTQCGINAIKKALKEAGLKVEKVEKEGEKTVITVSPASMNKPQKPIIQS